MSSTPSSKSSTSSECANCDFWVAKCMESDELGSQYQEWLKELLSAIHRDGGQYTTLAGTKTSVEDAIKKIGELYRERASMKRRLGSMMFGTRK